MQRRDFLALTAAAMADPLARGAAQKATPQTAGCTSGASGRLAGMSLLELRQHLHSELFDSNLPFWDHYGIDHKYGGFMCAIDHDGTRISDTKFHWFQGRGVWVYSFLYNHFGRNPAHLEIARQARDFMMAHFPQPDGTWAELVSREGKVLKPFHGDLFGIFFAAEGLQEYAYASGDEEARQAALQLMKQLFAKLQDPAVPDPETGLTGVRSQGVWMVVVRTATQMLRRWPDAEIAAMADHSIDMVLHKHYNPQLGLNTETLNLDGSRLKERANVTLCGHSVETLWMIMDEALRRQDQALYDLCAERLRRQLDVGWDHVFGGLADSVNVNQGAYQWPVDTPVGTNYQFREVGEYKWVKTSWAFDEVLNGTLSVIENRGSEWASRYFELAQATFDKKMSLKSRGLPLFTCFAERDMEFTPHVVRQENYHHPRRLMLSLLALDRMIKRAASDH